MPLRCVMAGCIQAIRVSLNERGFLTVKDRSNDLIISGGSNIYPREIEDVLLLRNKVEPASVIENRQEESGEEVVAFIVAMPGAEISTQELDDICLQHIARFKHPRRYVFVDDLPKNNHGKVLKIELRERLKKREQVSLSNCHCELPISGEPILPTDHGPPPLLLPHAHVILSVGFMERPTLGFGINFARKQSRFQWALNNEIAAFHSR